ncbi:33866_t:CDS:2, partial [Gigaspora margarita]
MQEQFQNYSNITNIIFQQIASILVKHGWYLHNFGLSELQKWTQKTIAEYQYRKSGARNFRQVAPVVKEAEKNATIDASIKTSYLWTYFDKYVLNQPIYNASDLNFAEFVDTIGNNWQEQK